MEFCVPNGRKDEVQQMTTTDNSEFITGTDSFAKVAADVFTSAPTNHRIMKRAVEFMKNNSEFDKVPTNEVTIEK